MSNEKTIWDFLMSKIGNPYGVAGLMGNLYAESRFDPGLLEGKYRNKLGMTSEEYTAKVDNGTYDEFVIDSAGYGLVQWTYWSRKQEFLNYMRSKKLSIGDLSGQLDFMYIEIQKYKKVFSTLLDAKSVKEASDIVMTRYEKCANQTDQNKDKRASFGQKFYDKYAVTMVETTDYNVNVRYGNGYEYPAIDMIRIRGTRLPLVATSENGWFAVVLRDMNKVGWIINKFSRIV